MLQFFARLGRAVIDIYGLPVLLGEKIWNWIPACIRDPIVYFLGPIILRQIELFSELAKDNDAWQRTKTEIGNLIKLVFKDHDLIGAVKAAFRFVLRVFNLPPEMLVTVLNKAMNAWDTISKKPLDFLKNTVRSLARGFGLLWKNFKSHLEFGLQGWLFGGLQEKNINPPASWTDPKALFFFVLDVLGLSVAHVFDLLKQRFNPERVEALRTWYGRISRVMDWINRTIDVNKSPAENTRGLIEQAKDFGKSILTDIATWVTVKVGEELALLAASAAASAGLSEVVDIARRIYKALVTAKRWAGQLLGMANNALDNILDIASGAVEKVGTKFEGILHQGMPVVIGFLADQVGLGGVGEEMRSIVDKLRAQVDKAILWLIDKVKAALDSVVGLARRLAGQIKTGIAAIGDWWRDRRWPVLGGGESHTLYFETTNTPRRFVCSIPQPIDEFILALEQRLVVYEDAARNRRERDAAAAQRRIAAPIFQQLRGLALQLTFRPAGEPTEREAEALMTTMIPLVRQLLSRLGTSRQRSEGEGQSIVLARYTINGESGVLAVPSGRVEEIGPFTALATNSDHPRHVDSEWQLLSHLALRFGQLPNFRDEQIRMSPQSNVRGSIHLASDFLICSSCQLVIAQFRRAFPNVHLFALGSPTPAERRAAQGGGS